MGASAAVRFAKAGFAIAGMCRRKESYAAAASALDALGAQHSFFKCDATEKSQVSAAFQAVRGTLGNPSVLVYNAGGGGFGIEPMDIDPEELVRSFRISCVGALMCSQEVIPGMLAAETGSKKKGTILFSSATSAFRGGAKSAQFACGKHALRALSQSIAKAYGSRGIHVCHVRLDCMLDVPTYRQRYADMYRADKLASTDEIANTYFAISEQSAMGWTNEIDIRPYTEGWTC
jgi:NAD(P)-dependent dehydrogenase (short-subunit alcohol dehydrogenase family)